MRTDEVRGEYTIVNVHEKGLMRVRSGPLLVGLSGDL
jgi:hypothetical protein